MSEYQGTHYKHKCSQILIKCMKITLIKEKFDRVGPIDNRPSTEYLHQFVKKKTLDM